MQLVLDPGLCVVRCRTDGILPHIGHAAELSSLFCATTPRTSSSSSDHFQKPDLFFVLITLKVESYLSFPCYKNMTLTTTAPRSDIFVEFPDKNQ